jgi:predicted secreted protein
MTLVMTLVALAVTSAAPKFTPYAAKADSFTVDLPGTPTVETETEKGDDGPVTTRTYSLPMENGAYLISVTTDPAMAALVKDSDVKLALDAFRDSQKGEGKVLSEKKVTMGKVVGREMMTSGAEMDSTARVFISGSHLYALMVAYEHGGKPDAAVMKRFFESFKLVAEAAPAAKEAQYPEGWTPGAEGAATPSAKAEVMALVGFSPDGAYVALASHGISDGSGFPWATLHLFDVAKNRPAIDSINVQMDKEGATEAQAIAEAKKQAEPARKKLKIASWVPGKTVAHDAKGQLTEAAGPPIGTFELKLRKAGKKAQEVCQEPFIGQLAKAVLHWVDDETPFVVADEKEPPKGRSCTQGCTLGTVYAYKKSAAFVLQCAVPGFEGPGSVAYPLTAKLPYGLDEDLPAQ